MWHHLPAVNVFHTAKYLAGNIVVRGYLACGQNLDQAAVPQLINPMLSRVQAPYDDAKAHATRYCYSMCSLIHVIVLISVFILFWQVTGVKGI